MRISGYDQELTEKDLLEALEKLYKGKPSKFPYSACYEMIYAFIDELNEKLNESEVNENEKY